MRENIDGCREWASRTLPCLGFVVAVIACIAAWISIPILQPIIQAVLPKSTPAPGCTDPARIVKYPTIEVSAKELWHDTGLSVENGDCIEFSSTGIWCNGISCTGPDGDGGWFIFRGPLCGECPAPEGNLGELVGTIGKGFPFRIGSSSTQKIRERGNLLFAMNDNAGSCEGGPPGSCYPKNSGKLNVDITVFHKQ